MTSLLVGPLPAPAWPEGIALRAFSEADRDEIHALLVLAYSNGFGEVGPIEEWWTLVTTDSEFDPSLVIVAAEGDRIVGFALVWDSAFIKDFVVHPDWRRRGLGRAMLSEIGNRLGSRGFPSVALKVRAGNHDARRLYERAGFRAD